jgi:hypothetical protein
MLPDLSKAMTIAAPGTRWPLRGRKSTAESAASAALPAKPGSSERALPSSSSPPPASST